MAKIIEQNKGRVKSRRDTRDKQKKLKDGKSFPQPTPKSLQIAERGIRTSHDLANFMSELMSDVIEGNVAPNVANAACNSAGKLLNEFVVGVRCKGVKEV
jgi:hypothetical protein